MHAGKKYTLKDFILWTRNYIYLLILFAILPTALYSFAGWKWVAIPWPPITLIGTAAALIIGFRNNATYSRAWEARQIWGRIVNTSRTFGIMAVDFIRDVDEAGVKEIHRRVVFRHLGWITALRHQLRQKRYWENARTDPRFIEFKKTYVVPEWETGLIDDLVGYLSDEEILLVRDKKNIAVQILALQSKELRRLNENGLIAPLNYVELEILLKELYDHQGASERIKNFPYPRQFVGISVIFVSLFALMVPLGMLNEFARLGRLAVWLNVPFSAIVSWVFISLEEVGESTENPFEGASNDVPISAISRTIEIDLKELLGLTDIPAPLEPVNNILM